jgi:hypothetical protein
MSTEHKRRFVRRVALCVSVVLLLPIWYVAAWLAVSRAAHDGYISVNSVALVRPVFVPLKSYCDAKRPGGAVLRDLWWTVNDSPESSDPFISGIRAEWLMAPNSESIYVE